MNTLTHALLPVIGAALPRLWAGGGGGGAARGGAQIYWSGRRLALLGVFGALPDLLHPHLSLDSRYASWTHGLPAVAVVALVLAVGWRRRLPLLDGRTAFACGAAYVFHLFCDAISGGIAWLQPFGDAVIAARLVPYRVWIPLDIACALALYLILRGIPRILEARARFRRFREPR